MNLIMEFWNDFRKKIEDGFRGDCIANHQCWDDDCKECHEKVKQMTEKRIALIKKLAFAVLALILLLPPLWSSWYTVQPKEVGIVLRCGKYVRDAQPGLNFKMPYPFEKVVVVPVQRQLKEEFGFRTSHAGKRTEHDTKNDYSGESLMLTGDLSVANVQWVAQYRISNPYKYLFAVQNAKEVFRDNNEAVMRKVVGDKSVTEVLTVGRQNIMVEAKTELQKLCDKCSLGISVQQIALQDVMPPKPVQNAFNEVNQAQQEREQLINEAMAAYNKVIPRAKGEAKRTIQQAQGWAIDRVNRARGDVAFFNKLLEAYEENPGVTKSRLYYETMQEILARAKQKSVIDSNINNLIPMMNVDNKGGLK